MAWWIAAAMMQITSSTPALEASGKWALDAASHGCVVTQSFSDGQAQLSIASPPLAHQLVISAKLAAPSKMLKSKTLAIVIGPGGERLKGTPLNFAPPGIQSREFGISVDPEKVPYHAIRDLSFEYDGHILATFKTGSWAALPKAIEECSRDLMIDYGIDPERERQVAISAVPKSVGTLILESKISDDARDQRVKGELGMRVQVGADGRIEQCTPVTSSGNKDIDERSCNLLIDKGRYVTAKDRHFVAVASEQLVFVRWVIAQ